ncbi:adenosine kinase [uncultured Croceicoccus sp.]|uniref:adenosine kinase n=1 Tax=uncultured Croceicoccus sp. TaxID=1295329 RepID=UPI00262216F6|nr:adenosine kinase [uncultured Croceicoccus sp.]
MSAEPYDIVALGDAIVDVLARRDDAFLAACGVEKGTMRLLADADAAALARAMQDSGTVDEIPGGSAANTLAGVAAQGARARFIGQTGADRLGTVFAQHMDALRIDFDTPPVAEAPTGRCFILISPDAQRTMQTAPGASHLLTRDALDEDAIRSARILFLEGYLWGPDTPRGAMVRAIEIARRETRTVAFTLSDSIVIPGRRDSLARLVADGGVDILFANEYEACLMAGVPDAETAIAALAAQVPTLVVTKGAEGALAIAGGERVEIAAAPVDTVIDTTGAGDQFAAGFLAAHARGGDIAQCLHGGAEAAAAVIAHVGARPLMTEKGNG